MNRKSAYDSLNWRRTDAAIAAALGVSREAVRDARNRRGIAPFAGHGGKRAGAGGRR